MEMSQGNSLYIYLEIKNVMFSITKSENKRVQEVLPVGVITIRGVADRGKPIGGSIEGKYCIYMHVKKNMTLLKLFQ
jgi:hypothetical protein